MRVAYLSVDEVNIEVAKEIALELGITIDSWFPKEGAPGPEFDAILVDLDSWVDTFHARERSIQQWLTMLWTHPVGLHSHDIDHLNVEQALVDGLVAGANLDREILARLIFQVQTVGPIEVIHERLPASPLVHELLQSGATGI